MANVKLRAAVRHIRRLVAEPRDRDRTDGELLRAFLSSNDKPSFAHLVKRHGPMVLSVCRRLLRQEQDAEDAFQATFLVLARKASAVHKQESLGSWLHGVAYHMATDARKAAARRRRRENEATPSGQALDPARAAAWHEVQAILDEEIARLPAVYREPFVLCCLEGRSCAEAAERLGQKEGTVWSRVARARQKLQQRLARRGVGLATALGAAAVSGNTALSAVPAALLGSTVEAATHPASGLVSPGVVALLRAGARAAFLARVKVVTSLLLAIGLAAAGLGFAAARPGPVDPPAETPSAEKKADAPEARTDRHGDPLPAEALARLGTVRFRHAERITSLAFTPNGKRLVSHGGDGLRAWDAATGRELASALREADGWTVGASLTRDGKTVIALEHGPNHFGVRVRGASDLKALSEFAVERPYMNFRVSPDGKYLAGVRDPEAPIDLWDVPSGKQIRSWNAHDRRIWTLQFSADGKTLVTCGEDKAIRFWDVATGKQERAITGYPDVAGVVALSPDGSRLATVAMTDTGPCVAWPRDNRVRLWDVTAGKEVALLRVPPKDRYHVADVAFARDGKTLVTAGPDDKVHVWDPANGKELRHLDLGELPGAVALSPKGDALAVAVGDRTVRLLDAASGKDVVSFGGHQQGLSGLVVTPDGRTVATADGRGTIRLWDPTAGRERARLEAAAGFGVALRLLGDGTSLLSRDADGVMRQWDLATGRERRRFKVPFAGYGFLDVSPDGKAVAGVVADGDKDFAVLVLELATGRVSHKLRGPWPCGSAFTPDGRTLVAWYYDRTIRVWDLADGRKPRQFHLDPLLSGGAGPEPFGPYPSALSPDGRLLAHANVNGQASPHLALQELATGKAVRVLDKLPDRVAALTFSPDGRTLAWGGKNDRTVHLVEVATGRERHVSRGHKGAFTVLAFSPDGRLLISGNEDTTALVWELTGRLGAAPPGPDGLAGAWADLAGDDDAAAYDALRRLAAAPADVVPFLRKHLPPVPTADEKRLARLVANLDGDEYAVREKASGELERLGDAAVPACRKALEGKPSAEMRQRLERLLEREQRGRWSPSGERLRQLRALEALELAGGDEARRLLEELAGGMAGAWLTKEAKAAGQRLSKR